MDSTSLIATGVPIFYFIRSQFCCVSFSPLRSRGWDGVKRTGGLLGDWVTPVKHKGAESRIR